MKKMLLLLLIVGLMFGCSNDENELVEDPILGDEINSRAPTGPPAPVLINNFGVGLNTSCHFNIIFVAEGFTSAEQGTFNTLANRARNAILDFEPFNGEEDNINFYRVNSVSVSSSATSGISEKQFTAPLCLGTTGTNVGVNTYWDVYKNRVGLSRYAGMTTGPRGYIDTLYGGYATGSWAQIIIITNTPNWWGGGSEFPGISEHGNTTFDTGVSIVSSYDGGSYFDYLVVHEFSHTFGGLADEYDNDTEDTLCAMTNYESWYMPATLEPNLKATNPGGWFQGGRYDYTTAGPWREWNNSIMKTHYSATGYSPAQEAAIRIRFKQSILGNCNPFAN